MSTAAQRRLDASPRSTVRWTYLRDTWTECPTSYEPEHVLAAPEDAVIKAIVRDRDHYSELLEAERNERTRLANELGRLREAVATIIGPAQRVELRAAQLDMFDTIDPQNDGRPYEVPVKVGQYL